MDSVDLIHSLILGSKPRGALAKEKWNGERGKNVSDEKTGKQMRRTKPKNVSEY